MPHFQPQEFKSRLDAVRADMVARGLDALLICAQESHYYLTGYDTGGYKQFQVAVLPADGSEPVLLTRHPDRQQALLTSTYADVRIWLDATDANPAKDLRAILEEKGLKGKKLGIELATIGLNAFNWNLIRQELEGFCVLEDASTLVSLRRMIKSPAELVYVRKAAAIADDVIRTVGKVAGPGVHETAVEAAALATVLRSEGDVSGAKVIFGSGPNAVLLRAPSGSRQLESGDQLAVEWAGIYRRYHAGIYRTFPIGPAQDRYKKLFETVSYSLSEMTAAAKPGMPLGDIDTAQRRVMDDAGFKAFRISSSGYSVGATFPPRGLPDTPPLLYAGNEMRAQAGMTIFLHAIYADSDTGDAMMLGHTLLITDTGAEVLSKLPVDYPQCL